MHARACTLVKRSLNIPCHPHSFHCSCPPSTLCSYIFPLAAAEHWEPCLPLSVSLVQSYQYWSERQGAPGHLRGHWPSAWNWKEQIARPNPKAVIAPSACILGVTMTPSVLPSASLYHYVPVFLKWSYGLKNAFPIVSQAWQDLTGFDRLCHCCEGSTRSAAPPRAQGSAVLLSRTLSDSCPLWRSKLTALHQHQLPRFKGNKP